MAISTPARLAAAVGVLALCGASAVSGPEAGRSPANAATAPADPSLAVQASICFPDAPPGRVRTSRGDGVILWTDAPLDGKALVAHLQGVERYLRRRLPTSRPAGTTRPARSRPPRAVALAIYARAADYHALWRRVASYYRGSFARIATEGFSYRVFCATSYDSAEKFRPRRSLVCHEFTHVWLYQRHGLPNDGNWLTEGIATAVQMHFFPRSGNRRDFARWMEAGRMLALKRLMDQSRITPKDYWQAGTLVELLMLRYADKLPAVVTAFNNGASAYHLVTKVLKTDFPTLRKQWAEYVHAAPPSRPENHPTSSPAPRQGTKKARSTGPVSSSLP